MDAIAYIDAIQDPRRQAEARTLDALFREVTGFAPRLYSGRMIGYGTYDYTYESGRSGTSFATGFAVSTRQIVIYVMPGYTDFDDIMQRIGKHRVGKACTYFTRLENADLDVLRELIRAGLDDLGSHWPVHPT